MVEIVLSPTGAHFAKFMFCDGQLRQNTRRNLFGQGVTTETRQCFTHNTHLVVLFVDEDFLPVFQQSRSEVSVSLVQQGAHVQSALNIAHLELGLSDRSRLPENLQFDEQRLVE